MFFFNLSCHGVSSFHKQTNKQSSLTFFSLTAAENPAPRTKQLGTLVRSGSSSTSPSKSFPTWVGSRRFRSFQIVLRFRRLEGNEGETGKVQGECHSWKEKTTKKGTNKRIQNTHKQTISEWTFVGGGRCPSLQLPFPS